MPRSTPTIPAAPNRKTCCRHSTAWPAEGVSIMTINAFTLHDTATAPAASADILENVQKAWGFVPNLHRVLAESPAALEAYATLWGIAEKTGFTPVERNIAYLSIIYENECTYCMAGHSNLSRMVKVEEDHIAAIRDGRPVSDARLEALRIFAAAVTRNRGVVSDAAVAATKLISNYANHLADTPLDPFMKGSEWTAPGKLKASV